MTLLLDTHALLGAVASPDELSERVRGLVLDRANTLVVSSASAWEIATKHRLGRLPTAEVLLSAFADHLGELGADELPISIRHALAAGAFASPHRDPFDRMLATQTLLEGSPLVSRDAIFSEFPVDVLW